MKFGLLMETAQTHQGLAEAAVEKLQAHTQGLDGVVRDEIRRTLVDELQALGTETKSATLALRTLRHTASARLALWSISVAALICVTTTAVALATASWMLPSRADIAALRARHEELVLAIARLEQHGAGIDLRLCGETRRYCVRVDRKAPAFGQKADYFVVAGY